MNPIKRNPLTFWIEYDPHLKTSRTYNIQKYLVESDHRVRSLGIAPEKYEYLSIVQTLENESKATVSLSDIIITLDMDAVEIVRNVYTIWDALGDIGGLIDILRLLGQPFISFIQVLWGVSLSHLLLKSLFKVQKKTNNSDTFSYLGQRRPFEVKACNWLLNHKNRR